MPSFETVLLVVVRIISKTFGNVVIVLDFIVEDRSLWCVG